MMLTQIKYCAFLKRSLIVFPMKILQMQVKYSGRLVKTFEDFTGTRQQSGMDSLQGNRLERSLVLAVDSFSSKKFKYSLGFNPFSFAVSTRLK